MDHSMRLPLAALLCASMGSAVADEKAQSYNIPAQPLHSALQKLADQAGVAVFFSENQVNGKTSPVLNGQYSHREALQKLLAGSGLTYTFTAEDSVSIKAVDAGSDTSTLPMIKVEASFADNDPFNPYYNRSLASTATKTDTPIMDTPFAIQVIPQQVIKDQQAIRVGDALKNVSGYFDTRGEEFYYDTAFLRGFNTGSSQYIDGLKDVSQSHSLANIEQVEVLKGTAGSLYGRLEPGGLINYTTKRPLDTPYYSIQQQFGSFDKYRTMADATGRINDSGSLLYRFNIEYLSSDSFIDVVHQERGFVAPSFTWKISPRTSLDLDFRYHNVNGPTTFGMPVVGKRPANVPISRYFGEPSLDGGNFDLFYGGLVLSHEFNQDWKLNAKVGYNDHSEFSQGIGIASLNETTGEASRWLSNYQYAMDTVQGLVNLTGKFTTWSIQHEVSLGGDLYKSDMKTRSSQYLCDGCSTTFPSAINIYQPMVYGQHGVNLAGEPLGAGSSGRDSWWGLYVQDQVTLMKDWHLLFGTRYDQATSSWDDSPSTHDGEFSPRVGLSYRPLNWLSIYGNYSKSLNAANASMVFPGTQRKPEMSEGYEAGFKGEWLNGRMNANLAFFELTKRNISQPNPNAELAAMGYQVFLGKGRSRGIELDVSGNLNENVSLISTYSYTDTRVVKDANFEGKEFFNVPKHAGSLWSKYTFTQDNMKGLWTGAGAYLAGKRQGDSDNSFQMPGYVRLDTAIGYAFNIGGSRLSLQFNVDNLLDKRYFTNSTWASRMGGIQAGASRTFLGSVKLEF